MISFFKDKTLLEGGAGGHPHLLKGKGQHTRTLCVLPFIHSHHFLYINSGSHPQLSSSVLPSPQQLSFLPVSTLCLVAKRCHTIISFSFPLAMVFWIRKHDPGNIPLQLEFCHPALLHYMMWQDPALQLSHTLLGLHHSGVEEEEITHVKEVPTLPAL